MNIYKGDIKRFVVKRVEFGKGAPVIKTESIVIKKDAKFYLGHTGRMISFDYNTYLPSQNEAACFLNEAINTNPDVQCTSCEYVDYTKLSHFDNVSRTQYKQMKKTYRRERALRKGK